MALSTKHSTHSAQETKELGEALGVAVKPQGRGSGATLVCLYGELGAGKTTFAQGFARGLGITTRLLSPTFIIVRRYRIPGDSRVLYHIDLYRIKEGSRHEDLGFGEIFSDERAIVLIEWAQYLGRKLPSKRIDVRFIMKEDDERAIQIKK